MTKMVTFTAEKRKRLQEAYDAAAKVGAETFTFNDAEYVTGYAKYLLEYLEMRKV